ncbi:hypothetical protein FH972_026102 [Carpinus fangiana]|uniref:Alpha 1,4-glycosyltransferase domain-containing protein n=1 Tax=Carpinus fangiana TaxID=176857 RepID=A0A5N6L2Y8_9ROSI|nr:hypothetical protein FH972_026102 [Carpinus fangiana]
MAVHMARWYSSTQSLCYEIGLTGCLDEAQDTFVAENFQDSPSILAFWRNLKSIILRADLIRYLAILSQGGIYTDIDTSNTAPIHEWIPEDMRNREINAVVGIEYDDDTYKMFVRRIEFCQWTLMAKPGHPIIKAVVQRVMDHLEYIARIKHTTLDQITLNKAEVLEATGPGAYSDAVLQVLRDQVGEYLEFESFSGMKEPTLYGDVLVLPINGFGFGQKHSHSGDPSYGRALARHHFGRSWYKTKPDTSQGKAKTQKKKNDPETKA